jgi:hypothetical protein
MYWVQFPYVQLTTVRKLKSSVLIPLLHLYIFIVQKILKITSLSKDFAELSIPWINFSIHSISLLVWMNLEESTTLQALAL